MKRITVLVVFLLLLVKQSNLYAQTVNLNQGFVEQKEYFVTLPYQELKNKVIIEVFINNKSESLLLILVRQRQFLKRYVKNFSSKQWSK